MNVAKSAMATRIAARSIHNAVTRRATPVLLSHNSSLKTSRRVLSTPANAPLPSNLNVTDPCALDLINTPPPPPKVPLLDEDQIELSSVTKAIEMLEQYDVEREDLAMPEHLVKEDEVHSTLEVEQFHDESPPSTGLPLPFWPSLETGLIRRDLLHRVFVHQRNKFRGKRTARVKTYNEKSGSGKKPHAQKGTGRARQGNKRRPGNKGGLKAHGPKGTIQDYGDTKLNKKMMMQGGLVALRARMREGNIKVVEGFGELAKTKAAEQGILGVFGDKPRKGVKDRTLLLMGGEKNEVFLKASKNVFHAHSLPATCANTWDVLRNHRVIMDRAAWEELREKYA